MAAARLIPANWQLPTSLLQRIGTAVGRQRVLEYDGHLLLVAHEVPRAGEINRRGVLFWRDPDGNWKASNGEPGAVAISNLLGRYEKTIEEYDRLEAKAQRSDEYLPLLEGLAPCVRSSRNLSEVLQEARKSSLDLHELIDVRDRAYEIARTAELLHQDAKHSMEVAVVRRAEEQAASSAQMAVASHRLNKLAALFFPLATLGAIFGTTLTENWDWSQSAYPFLIFLGSGILMGLLLAMFVNRKAS